MLNQPVPTGTGLPGLITKVKITDSQSGLRLLSKKATIIYSNKKRL